MATVPGAKPAPPATDGAGSDAFDVHNPADGSTIAMVPIDGPDAVRETVARVRATQPEWEALGIEGRHRWLARLRDWLFDHYDEVLDTMQRETGKVRGDAAAEIPYLADVINFYGENAGKFLGDERVRAHLPLLRTRGLRVRYRPHPVVGIISPWNYPLTLSLGDALPALQAGCAVVTKPSEYTPLGIRAIVEAWKEEIGGPDVLDVVNGMGETGSALVDNVDFIQFTGSERTGRKVMARAAERLIPVSLELGGKDPMIVLEGADLDRAANAASFGSFFNSGQTCMATERIYVEEPVYDEFIGRLTAEARKLRQGVDGRDYSKDVGAMTSPEQIGIVEDHVNDALSSGARALSGGKRADGPGDFYEPTVLVDVDHSMKVMRDETFGPVVGVMKVRDAEHAVELANDTRYGLSGAVFGPAREAEAVARCVECGVINVNDVLINYLMTDVPMGGWKTSGIGYRHGAIGIRKYCRSQSIVVSRLSPKRELFWHPYGPRRRSLVRRMFRLFSARGLGRRLGRD